MAQKLVSPKDERSVGFSDGASPHTRIFYYKHIICDVFADAFSSSSIQWVLTMLKVAVRVSNYNRQDSFTLIYLQLKQSQIKREETQILQVN